MKIMNMISIDKGDLKMIFDRDFRCGCAADPMFNAMPNFENKEAVGEMAENMPFDMQDPDCMCPKPICEPPQERCMHRCIVHEIKHICPIRTKIINHHIYKHIYCPTYTCCEEDQVCHLNQGSCCNF